MNVLVINSGSSSIRFKIINTDNQKVLCKGHVEGINQGFSNFFFNNQTLNVSVKNHDEAINLVLSKINHKSVDAVGHRFVHGGSKYLEPVKVSNEIIKDLKKLQNLAPLHNPSNLKGVIACFEKLKKPQVVVFDTAFYKDLPAKAFNYALPLDIRKKGIRKYGFHGISHEFLLSEAKNLIGREHANIISCHLGNGCSVSCIKNDCCIDTSMGFTPLEGLVMGTRSGSIDPGVLIFLQEQGYSSSDINELLNKKSGLLGLCGHSDMREIYKAMINNDENAFLAIDMFCYKLIKEISAFLGIMSEDTHALVFSGGIGENAFYVRKKVCDSLKHLGVEISYEKNMHNNGEIKKPSIISKQSSKVKILVIPTNEESLIANKTRSILKVQGGIL